MSEKIQDVILLLVNADSCPVQGKTMFMYQMFLIMKEVFQEIDVSFFPYQLGPYSNVIAHETNWLIENDFIQVTKKGRTMNFEITSKGLSFGLSLCRISLDEKQKSGISRVKKNTHELGLKKTRQYLERQYNEYFINAR